MATKYLKFLVPTVERVGGDGNTVQVATGLTHHHVVGNTTLQAGDIHPFEEGEAKRLIDTYGKEQFADSTEAEFNKQVAAKATKAQKGNYENKAAQV